MGRKYPLPGGQVDRRAFLAASGASLSTLLAGCTGEQEPTETPGGGAAGTSPSPTDQPSPGSESGSSELTPTDNPIHVMNDYSGDQWQTRWEDELVPAWEEKTEIPIKLEYVGYQGQGGQRLMTLLQSGNPPEIYTSSLAEVGNIIMEGQMLPVDDLVSELEQSNGEYPYKHTLGFGGNYYKVPHALFLGGSFHYRADIYDELGLSPPETWEDVVQNAKAIDEADDIEPRGFAQPGVKAGKSSSEFDIWLRTAGASQFRWKSDDQEEAEVWLPKEESLAVLTQMEKLAQYSPDPTSISWGDSLQYWAGGRVAQMIMLNAWGGGVATRAGNVEIGNNTEVTTMPTPDGEESEIDRGWVSLDGISILDADMSDAAERFTAWAWGEPERAAKNVLTEPMHYLPPTQKILKSETYQNASFFEEHPHMLELQKYCFDEIAPTLSNPDLPQTGATVYAGSFPMLSEMVNFVLTGSKSKEAAYEEAKQRLKKRLAEGKEKASGM